jgi:hypothetical protein
LPAVVRSWSGRRSRRAPSRRWCGWLAIAVGIAFLAGCSSAPSTDSEGLTAAQEQQLARYSSAEALLAQCTISRGVQAVLRSAERYNAAQVKTQRWLAGRKIEVTPGNGSAMTDWWDNGGGAAVVFAGQQLGDWQEWAALHRKLPAQVCGAAISGAALQRLYGQVYAQWPAERNDDPW